MKHNRMIEESIIIFRLARGSTSEVLEFYTIDGFELSIMLIRTMNFHFCSLIPTRYSLPALLHCTHQWEIWQLRQRRRILTNRPRKDLFLWNATRVPVWLWACWTGSLVVRRFLGYRYDLQASCRLLCVMLIRMDFFEQEQPKLKQDPME